MKELSIEEKAKRYDEAIELAKEINNEQRAQPFNVMIRVFPELKESDDEVIRKDIVAAVETYGDFTQGRKEEIYIWLKRQGEKKPVPDEVNPKFKVGDVIINKKSKDTVKIVQILHDSYCYSGWDGAATVHSDFSISEQDNWELVEQKPTEEYNIRGIKSKHAEGKLGEMIKEMEATDKVEPKFHEGDWVLNNVCFPIQIASTEGDMYVFTDGEAISSSFVDENYHLWSIQDAEDGDVLVKGNEIVIFKENNFNQKDLSGCMFVHCILLNNVGYWYTIGGINPSNYAPATKEQRDTLMKAMTDAGYTFDFDKKELKLLITNGGDFESENCEQKPTNNQFTPEQADILDKHIDKFLEQNPTWSEEDKKMFVNIKACLRNANKDYSAELDWLKSLKDRYTWKPSDEQIKALNYVVNLMASSESQKENDYYYNVFKVLREQLKRL